MKPHPRCPAISPGIRDILLDLSGASWYALARIMENASTTHIDLSTLDTEAMRSRLSELGSYL